MQKRWKNLLFGCIQILLNVAYCVTPYLRIFKDVAVLPGYDSSGQFITGRFTYPRSARDRLHVLDAEWLLWVGVVFAGISILLSILFCLRWRKKGARWASWIAWGASTALFLLIMLTSAPQRALY